ncbi:hypothetical protein A5708_12090 [Mycobacterium colombiense]|uniref:AAA family ATPase n=2 Tax=Mycobacterium colombiense TaxID=339268 RepID=A0A1A2ZD00_9MYCO|nr:hypothetical protein A5708_12090 [Mycobacterium colombiense]
MFEQAHIENGSMRDNGRRKFEQTVQNAKNASVIDPPEPLEDRPNLAAVMPDNTTFDPNADAADDARNTAPQYTDVAAYLAGGMPEPPKPSVLHRIDDVGIFYLAKRNDLYGDPEDGKTMVLLAAAVGAIDHGGCVLFIDLDNNGPAETVARMLMLGVDPAVLADPNRFRHIEPADSDEVLRVVADCAGWATFAGIDCVGELMPLFRASSDSADDYTRVMQAVSAPLERGGAAVILLDHQAKGTDSRKYGAGGTMAKRRAVSGVSINLVRKRSFVPGQGGMAELWVNKDRPGGLRAHCQKSEGRRQFAGTFILDPPNPGTGVASWRVTPDHADAAATTFDAQAERYLDVAREIDGPFTASDLAAGVHGEVPPTDAQRETARRNIDRLVESGRLRVVDPGGRGRGRSATWTVSPEVPENHAENHAGV